MRRASRPLWCVLLVVAVLACSDDENGAGPVEPPAPPEPAGPPPSVLATVSLSDAPVEGELVLTPAENGPVWDFAVDLDGDGAFDDAEETVDGERRVPYRFTEVGLHPVAVRFERPGTRVTVERMVAVNDPDAFALDGRIDLDDRANTQGIAITGDNRHLFVGGSTTGNLLRLDSSDLSVLDEVSFLALPRELALSPEDERLFVQTKRSDMRVFSVPDLELLHTVRVLNIAEGAGVQSFVETLDERHVIVSGDVSVLRVDVESDSVIAGRPRFDDLGFPWDIALSPDRRSVALLTGLRVDPNQVHLLDATTLENVWMSEISRPVILSAIAFHPSGQWIYAFGFDDRFVVEEQAYWLFVLRADSGEITDRIRIEPVEPFAEPSVANPSAITHDGRFAVFPTRQGAYFIDTELHLPRFRLDNESVGFTGIGRIGCCDVATPAGANAVYFANSLDVHRVRLLR